MSKITKIKFNKKETMKLQRLNKILTFESVGGHGSWVNGSGQGLSCG